MKTNTAGGRHCQNWIGIHKSFLLKHNRSAKSGIHKRFYEKFARGQRTCRCDADLEDLRRHGQDSHQRDSPRFQIRSKTLFHRHQYLLVMSFHSIFLSFRFEQLIQFLLLQGQRLGMFTSSVISGRVTDVAFELGVSFGNFGSFGTRNSLPLPTHPSFILNFELS